MSNKKTPSFEFNIYHNNKQCRLKAEWIYESAQIQRIKISHGNNSFIVENDIPFLKSQQLRKKVNWKYRGAIKPGWALMLHKVINEIEYHLKYNGTQPINERADATGKEKINGTDSIEKQS